MTRSNRMKFRLRILLIAITTYVLTSPREYIERVWHASPRSDQVGNEKAMRGEKTSNHKVYFCCELLLLRRHLYLFGTKP